MLPIDVEELVASLCDVEGDGFVVVESVRDWIDLTEMNKLTIFL